MSVGRLGAWFVVFGLFGCDAQQIADISALQGDPGSGQAVYQDQCAECHDSDLSGTNKGPSLTNKIPRLSDETLISIILRGNGDMPPIDGNVTDQQISDLVSFLRQQTQ